MVEFWSSRSLVVFDELQSRIGAVHVLRFDAPRVEGRADLRSRNSNQVAAVLLVVQTSLDTLPLKRSKEAALCIKAESFDASNNADFF